jgi:hypothetical protein
MVIPLEGAWSITTPIYLTVYHAGLLDRHGARPLSCVARL